MFGFRHKYQREIAHFVQLSSKLGRRLGIARSRARQAEIDRDFWRDRAKENAQTALELRDENADMQIRLNEYKHAIQREIDERREAKRIELPNIPINTRPGF
jgi:hypothetical protein